MFSTARIMERWGISLHSLLLGVLHLCHFKIDDLFSADKWNSSNLVVSELLYFIYEF